MDGKQLVEAPLGKEAKIGVSMSGGKLCVEVAYDGAQADATLKVALDSDLFLDKLAELIPGKIDDAVISVIKMSLKALG